MIAMVNEEVGRGVEDFTVHPNGTAGAMFAGGRSPAGVIVAVMLDDVPFEFVQPEEVVWVNDGEFTFCKGDKADILAEADTMKKIQREKQEALKPARGFDFESKHTPSLSEAKNPFVNTRLRRVNNPAHRGRG